MYQVGHCIITFPGIFKIPKKYTFPINNCCGNQGNWTLNHKYKNKHNLHHRAKEVDQASLSCKKEEQRLASLHYGRCIGKNNANCINDDDKY